MIAPTRPFDTAEGILALGLRDRWYPLCPSEQVRRGELTRIDRAGEELLLWRDASGAVHVQEDRCPHRGARLSLGVHMGDRIACNYHGVQLDTEGTVVSVPGSPGCSLEGRRALRTFPAEEHAGAIFAWFGLDEQAPPAPLHVPEPIAGNGGTPASTGAAGGSEWAHFLCYVEWDAPYLYSLDNLLDPMHGAFLHRDSHTMFAGKQEAEFQIRASDNGFVFEKTDQRGVNFDWVRLTDAGAQWITLDIPYPDTAGPGGPFTIVAALVAINEHQHAGFFWRCRKVAGWQRDSWRFLYRNRLEARHWQVLEQDRGMAEAMPADAWARENPYQHDIALIRMRRMLRAEASKQAATRDQPAEQPTNGRAATASQPATR